MAEDVIDCMTCLIQHANGLPMGGMHIDSAGVTHSTVKWLGKVVIVCTLAHANTGMWFVVNETVST